MKVLPSAHAILLSCLLTLMSAGILFAGTKPKSKVAMPPDREALREREERIPGGISEDESEEILKREQYFHDRRAGGPGKLIPEDAYARSMRQKEMLRAGKSAHRSVMSSLPP